MNKPSFYTAVENIIEAYHFAEANIAFFITDDEQEFNRGNVFPAVYIVVQPSLLTLKTTDFNFEIQCIDQVDWNPDDQRDMLQPQEGQDNLLDILNSTHKIHTIALMKLRELLHDVPMEVNPSRNLSPIKYGGANVVAGWTLQCSIKSPNASVTDGVC